MKKRDRDRRDRIKARARRRETQVENTMEVVKRAEETSGEKKAVVCAVHAKEITAYDEPTMILTMKDGREVRICVKCSGAITRSFLKFCKDYPEYYAYAGIKPKQTTGSRIIDPVTGTPMERN